jgi:molecular chaperone GrpE (heat shock protein)
MLDRRGDGWLDQLAREYKIPQGNQASRLLPRPANFDERVKQLKQQIVRLRETNRGDQVKRVAAALAAYKKRFAEPEEEGSPTTNSGFVTEQIVTQAFLRTLSRHPSEEELVRSVEYVNAEENKINGVRGLVWALLNTKEFIVNH